MLRESKRFIRNFFLFYGFICSILYIVNIFVCFFLNLIVVIVVNCIIRLIKIFTYLGYSKFIERMKGNYF